MNNEELQQWCQSLAQGDPPPPPEQKFIEAFDARIQSSLVQSIFELEGLTISNVCSDFNRTMTLAFTTGQFIVIDVEDGYDGCLEMNAKHTIDVLDHLYDLVRVGLVSQDVAEEYKAAHRVIDQRREQKRKRAEYERLKKEFGNPGDN